MFLDTFKRLGFTENEGVVYSSLLNLGIALPSTIASRTGLKRPNVYRILEELSKKNLILKIKQKNGTFFTIDDVRKIYFSQREKAELAEHLVQDLEKQILPTEKWEVTYYKGKQGCIKLYNDILEREPDELTGWVNLDEFYKQVGKEFDLVWTKRRVKKGINVRLIMAKSTEAKNFQKKDVVLKRETRWLPSGKDFKTVCLLYKNNIIFFSGGIDPLGIHIVSEDLYHMQMQIFEMNWGQATK